MGEDGILSEVDEHQKTDHVIKLNELGSSVWRLAISSEKRLLTLTFLSRQFESN
jgi:hypothetical protein